MLHIFSMTKAMSKNQNIILFIHIYTHASTYNKSMIKLPFIGTIMNKMYFVVY